MKGDRDYNPEAPFRPPFEAGATRLKRHARASFRDTGVWRHDDPRGVIDIFLIQDGLAQRWPAGIARLASGARAA
ncbi:hypothetical protein [Paraburkholderia oxyphila]|uniref:hypothetical protein n=1 Tax=Paraburkholderia oxyphila TaxID=614212 RepID=UPI0005B7CAE2|nr:hypothetical protein [Paraburkholderia oxyphila]